MNGHEIYKKRKSEPYRKMIAVRFSPEEDKRVKISKEKKDEILWHKGKLSQRKTAKKFEVSRRSVVFIWFPERLKHAKKLYKERQKDGRYYVGKKRNAEYQKNIRHRKVKKYKNVNK